MSEEEKYAIEILKNEISDYVIGDYCSKCDYYTICEDRNEDCYYIWAIDTILDLYNKQKERIKELSSKLTEKICNGVEEEILEEYRQRVKELEEIEKEHQKQNGELQEKIKEYEKIVEAYNVIPNDYIPKDMKIVIADREYFANGILKETCLPKSKIKEKIEELEKERKEFTLHKHSLKYDIYSGISVLQELLEE